jgi:hypothetical protein
MLPDLRPRCYRDDQHANDHGAFDFEHHQVGGNDTTTHEANPQLLISGQQSYISKRWRVAYCWGCHLVTCTDTHVVLVLVWTPRNLKWCILGPADDTDADTITQAN